MRPQNELIALALWTLVSLSLLTPGLMYLVLELSPTTSINTQLITNIVISLCIFLLPTRFFSSGTSAWHRLFVPLPPKYRQPKYLLKVVGLSLLTLFIAHLLYTGIVELAQIFGYRLHDAIEMHLQELISSGAASRPLLFISMAIVPAITEEFFFRGILQEVLHRHLPQHHRLPLLLTAGIFALFHGTLVGFPSRMLLGVMLGYLAKDSRSLRLPILFHLLNNTLALLSIL